MTRFSRVPDGDRRFLETDTKLTVLDATGARVGTLAETPSTVLLELDIHSTQGSTLAFPLTLKSASDLSRLLRTAVKHQLGLDEEPNNE